MIGLAHFVHFLSFSIGLVAIYISVTLNRSIQSKALKSYTSVLIGTNFIIFIHILEAFFKTVISDDFYDLWFRPVFWYMIVPLAAVRLFLANRFLYFAVSLNSRKFYSWFNYVFIAFFAMYLIWIIRPDSDTEVIRLNAYSVIYIHLLLFLSFFYGSFILLQQGKNVAKVKIRSIKPIGWFFLIYAVFLFLLRLANFPVYRMHEDVQMLGLGLLALAFNLLNAIFLRRFFSTEQNFEVETGKLELYAKYKITKREEEIINLICTGKTNKEIAEKLFISPVTVRDHLTSIYRKVNVNNRTQLAGIFNSKV